MPKDFVMPTTYDEALESRIFLIGEIQKMQAQLAQSRVEHPDGSFDRDWREHKEWRAKCVYALSMRNHELRTVNAFLKSEGQRAHQQGAQVNGKPNSAFLRLLMDLAVKHADDPLELERFIKTLAAEYGIPFEVPSLWAERARLGLPNA